MDGEPGCIDDSIRRLRGYVPQPTTLGGLSAQGDVTENEISLLDMFARLGVAAGLALVIMLVLGAIVRTLPSHRDED